MSALPRLSAGPVRSQLLYAVVVRDDVPILVPHYTAANALQPKSGVLSNTSIMDSLQCGAVLQLLREEALPACLAREAQARASCVSEPSFSVLKSATETTDDAALWNTRSAASSSTIAALHAGGRRLTAVKATLHISCTAAERRLHAGPSARMHDAA